MCPDTGSSVPLDVASGRHYRGSGSTCRICGYPAQTTLAASQRSQEGSRSSHLTRRWRQLKQPVRLLLFLGIVFSESSEAQVKFTSEEQSC